MRIQRERESWADAILQGLAFLVCGALYIFALLVFLPGCSDAQPRDPPVVEDYCACMTQDDLQGLKEVGEVNTRLMDTIGRLEERIQVLEERVMARPEPEPVSFQEPEAPEEDDGGMEEPIPDYGGEIQSVREDVQEANEYTSREIAAVNSRLDSLEGRQGVTPAQLNEVRSALSTLADQYHNPVQTWRTPLQKPRPGSGQRAWEPHR